MTTQQVPSGFFESAASRTPPVSPVVFTQDCNLRYTWIHNPNDGFPPEEIIGKTDEELFAADEARSLTAIKHEVISTGEGQRLEVRLTLRGTTSWYNLSVYPERTEDGHVVGVVCTAVNISNLKRTEEVLRQRAQRLALLFEAATGLLASSDPMRFLEQLFARLTRLFDLDVYAHFAVAADGTHLRLAASGGLSSPQRQAMDRLEFGQLPCGAVASSRHPIIVSDALRSNESAADAIRALGLRSYVCHPLVAGGELFGTLAFGSVKEAEHTYESVGLFRAVSDLVALGIARHRAEQSLRDADRRKDEFIATLAHELRNPLAPIRSGIDLMQASKEDSAAREVTLAVMERQVVQLTRLVDDLLEVSRITQGRLELRLGRVELSSIIENALDQTRELFAQVGHVLTIDLPQTPVVLNGDPVRLAQVVANLLSNAAKYTPEHGHICVRAEIADDAMVLSVRDDGIGIPAEKLFHVFEMFEQVDRSFERSYKGLGLGLTLVKSLVEMHGGSAEAHSDGPSRGSEFTIRLPIERSAAAEEPKAPGGSREANASAGAWEPAPATEFAAPNTQARERATPVTSSSASPSRRVLIVDDNVDAATMLGQLVKLMGHETRIVFDGFEALDAVPSFLPDVVLLDIGMPKMNGYEVASRIRADAAAKHPILVALTGWGQTKDKQRAAYAGFDHYLVKPVQRDELREFLIAPPVRRGS